MEKNTDDSHRRKNTKRNYWALKIFITTFIISCFFSLASQKALSFFDNTYIALTIIAVIVLVGVFFDIIGIAVAAASEVPFLSMAAKKIRGARQAIKLIKNADQVSSFCNDVVGDICGIISGAAGSVLSLRIIASGFDIDFLSIIISSIIAAFTVGGKALGKTLAINNSQHIIYSVGYFLSFFSSGGNEKKSLNSHERRERQQ